MSEPLDSAPAGPAPVAPGVVELAGGVVDLPAMAALPDIARG